MHPTKTLFGANWADADDKYTIQRIVIYWPQEDPCGPFAGLTADMRANEKLASGLPVAWASFRYTHLSELDRSFVASRSAEA